jgi:hypothetical protein
MVHRLHAFDRLFDLFSGISIFSDASTASSGSALSAVSASVLMCSILSFFDAYY